MNSKEPPLPSFVIKAKELGALNYLQRGHPRPQSLTWINRATDQKMNRSNVEMLMRTLFSGSKTASVARLHETAGLRVAFEEERDRLAFARAFDLACEIHRQRQRSHLTAVFENPELAETGFRELTEAGIGSRAISILWRAGQFMESNHDYPPGHSKWSVTAATTGGGLAGAIFGITLLAVPGLGAVAAGGAIVAQALTAMGIVGGSLGATGGAIAKMLTDLDVDDREASYFEMQIRRGRVFVSVDPAEAGDKMHLVREILERNGGTFANETTMAIRRSICP